VKGLLCATLTSLSHHPYAPASLPRDVVVAADPEAIARGFHAVLSAFD
jgi:hypothetical protein